MIHQYNKLHCWQYDIRLQRQAEDRMWFYTQKFPKSIEMLRVSDFSFQYESKVSVYDEAKHFIERYEWLGRMSLYPTHIFTARYQGHLAGVVIMDMPTAFSKMLGDDTKKLERLISRGACASWTPPNLASSLIMWSIKWCVKNTPYRLFTAYSDPEAKELGTIYQACNFYYLGQKFGSSKQYQISSGRWVSDRYFRSRSTYKRIAKEFGFMWQPEWQDGDKVFFDKMPESVVIVLKYHSKLMQQQSPVRALPKKHKYAYIKGATKGETRKLKKLFESKNKTYEYPRER